MAYLQRPIAAHPVCWLKLCVLFSALGAVTPASLEAQVVQDTVVMETNSGTPVNAPGTFSGSTSFPIVNNLGQVAYFTSYSQGEFEGGGLVVGDSVDNMFMAAFAGQASPDGDGVMGLLGPELALNDRGQVLFESVQAFSPGGTVKDRALGFFDPVTDVLQIVARESEPAPGGGESYLGFNNLELGADGTLFFEGTLQDSRSGLYRGKPGQISRLILQGDAVPAGHTINRLDAPGMSPNGMVGFHALLGGGPAGWAVFLIDPSGTRFELAREDQAIPGGSLRLVAFNVFEERFTPNRSGQITFKAGLNDSDGGAIFPDGVFIASPGVLTEIVRQGDGIPGDPGFFGEISADLQINDAGQVLFFADIEPTPTTTSGFDSGIFLFDGSSIRMLARTGQAAPGGGTYDLVPVRQALNNAGHVMFLAGAEEEIGGGPFSVGGIYFFDGTTTRPIARVFWELPGLPQDIGHLFFSKSRDPVFTDTGYLAFSADFQVVRWGNSLLLENFETGNLNGWSSSVP